MRSEGLTMQERVRIIEERLGDAVADTITPPNGAYPDVTPLANVISRVDSRIDREPNMWPRRPNAQITSSLTSSTPYRSQISRIRCPVALRWSKGAPGVLQRFHEHRGDGVRPFHLDAQCHVVGTPQRARIEVLTVMAAVAVRRLHLDRPGHSGSNGVLIDGHAGHAERAHRRAVVRQGARDHLRALRVARSASSTAGRASMAVSTASPPRRGQEDPVEVAGRQRGQPGGQLDGRFVGERPDREVAERLGLPRRGLAQLGSTVARPAP